MTPPSSHRRSTWVPHACPSGSRSLVRCTVERDVERPDANSGGPASWTHGDRAVLRGLPTSLVVPGGPIVGAGSPTAGRDAHGHPARRVPWRGRRAGRPPRPVRPSQLPALTRAGHRRRRARVRLPRLDLRRRRTVRAGPRTSATDRTQPADTRQVPSHAAVEQDGIVWAWGEPDAEPVGVRSPSPSSKAPAPVRSFSGATSSAPCTPRWRTRSTFRTRPSFIGGSSVAANPAPSPRCAGRSTTASRCSTSGSRSAWDRSGCERIAGRTFDHWDRFFLPSIAQIEYAVEGGSESSTRSSTCRCRRSEPAPGSSSGSRAACRLPVVRPVVLRRGKQILRQDARALARADRADTQPRRRALRVDRARPPRQRDLAPAASRRARGERSRTAATRSGGHGQRTHGRVRGMTA